MVGLLISGTVALANPLGPQVVHGQVTFGHPTLQALNITNSPGAIINWQSFSIQHNEITRFIQQHADSAVLNRIVGQDPSAILGQLLSNGRVFLINPNGIVFGPNSVVDTAGLIASALNMTDEDFLAGRYRFDAGPEAGDIRNQGFIRAGKGGEVVLIAPNIENSGIIEADEGKLILAAGRKVTLTSLDLDGIEFEIQAPENEVVNLGKLIAERGAVGVFAGTIKHSGVIEADGIAIDNHGNVVLTAKGDINLEQGSVLTANGPSGGTITVESDAGTTWVSGAVEAKGIEEEGGTIHLLGDRVGLIGKAVANVSGELGGGEVLIGGDYKGQGEVRNASGTFVGQDTTIRADAITSGDGGKVIVWADEATRSYGRISARGGAESGDGGFVETSGGYLEVDGSPDVSAANGKGGTWLLDPLDITIGLANVNNTGPPAFTPTGAGSTINVADINAQLNADGSVTIDTNVPGPDAGNITVSQPISKSAGVLGSSLTFNACNDLAVNATITASPGQQLVVSMNPGNVANVNANIDLTGLGVLVVDTGTVNLNGVALNTGNAQFATTPGSNSTVTLDGGSWTSGVMLVGVQGTSALNVINGGQLNTCFASIGDQGGSNGTVTIDGAGASWTNTSSVNVGFEGTGDLTVQNGGTINSRFVGFGSQPGSQGTGLVTNPGSQIVTVGADNNVRVGGQGNGTFTLSNGAMIDTLQFEVARDGTGVATITDPGTLILASNDNGNFSDPAFANEGGFVRAGRNAGSRGTINLQNGARIEIRETTTESAPGLQLGRNLGSFGELFVDGPGTVINISQSSPVDPNLGGPFVQVGRGGDGNLQVRNGAEIRLSGTESRVLAGQNAGASGSVLVTGPGSKISVTGFDSFFHVGRDGTGTLRIESGGVVDPIVFLNVGRNAGSSGSVTITGTGSKLLLSGNGLDTQGNPNGPFLTIGRSGTGTVDVLGDGKIEIIGGSNPFPGLNIGRDAGGVGTLTVDGIGSSVTVSSDLTGTNTAIMQVGRAGQGTMLVRNSAQVLNDPDGNAIVGRDPGAVGQATVDGAGSIWDAGNLLLVGQDFDFTTGQPISPGGIGLILQTNGGVIRANTIELGPGAGAVVQEINAISTDQVLVLQNQQDFSASEPLQEQEKEDEEKTEQKAGSTAAATEQKEKEHKLPCCK